MKDLTRLALLGAAAGAAGTTALNVVTYLDMAVRGRPASSTPEMTVEKLSEKSHVRSPARVTPGRTGFRASGCSRGWSPASARASCWVPLGQWAGVQARRQGPGPRRCSPSLPRTGR